VRHAAVEIGTKPISAYRSDYAPPTGLM